jgi:crossover junction endodeoxyribonuclease RuvC
VIVFGVDPGYGGAIAELHPRSGQLYVHDMPTLPGPKGKVELDLYKILYLLDAGEDRATVWLEKVASRPGQGISSAFRFGEQFGALQMAVAARGHVLRMVTPSAWKKHFGLSADKGVARGLAMRRFPAQAEMFARVKDDGRAEAALIALYGMEEETNA